MEALDFLFLCKGDLPFLLNNLKGILEQDGFTADKCDIGLKHLSEKSSATDLFIVEAMLLYENLESRVFLIDHCIEKSKKIVLIGNMDELERVKPLISANVIAEIFERPLNIKDASKKLEKLVEDARFKKNQKKIMIIDDSPVFLRMMSGWLENDYCVSICPSAMAAFHILVSDVPDLILLDYEMPVCNGPQFLLMLKNETTTADIPVMFLTSRGDGQAVKSAIALKPQGYLLKNQTREQILKAIEDFFKKLGS